MKRGTIVFLLEDELIPEFSGINAYKGTKEVMVKICQLTHFPRCYMQVAFREGDWR